MKGTVEPMILPTKVCHDYVGGRTIWQELMKHYGEGNKPKLKPFRRTPQGHEYWHREVVEDVLRLAQMEGRLLAPEVSLQG